MYKFVVYSFLESRSYLNAEFDPEKKKGRYNMSHNSPTDLTANYAGKTLHDIPMPAVVLDLAKIEVNCQRMLDVVNRLSLSWRAHIKTHKASHIFHERLPDL